MKMSIILFIQLAGALLLQACNPLAKSNNGINTSVAPAFDVHSFRPDTSINSLLLNNPISIENSIGNIMPLLNEEAAFPDLYLLNNNKKEYLRLVLFPGSTKNSISQFEVGYYEDLPTNTKTTSSKTGSFYTESMIKLGITKEQLQQEKGMNYNEKEIENIIIVRYVLTDFNKSAFLKRYNMPVYFAEYYFKENKLIKYWFGFEYP